MTHSIITQGHGELNRTMKINIKLVIFTVLKNKLAIYLTDTGLPGGMFIQNQALDNAASLIFKKNIGVSLTNLYFEQLYTFSSPKLQEISVVYYFLVPEHKIYSNMKKWLTLGSDLMRIKGLTLINKIDAEIIHYAVQRLRWKIEYTNVVYSLLPPEFTFSQLQSSYEAILGKALDKRNFRKKIAALNLLVSTGHMRREGPARPAEMFAFRKRELTFVQIL